MLIGLVGMLIGALGGMAVARDVIAGLPCYAPASVCEGGMVTLACIAAVAGGVAAGAAGAAADETDPRGWYPATVDTEAASTSYDRPYAQEPPPGYQPPERRSPQEALNDPEFQRQRDEYAYQHRDTSPLPASPSVGERAAGTLVKSLRHAGSR